MIEPEFYVGYLPRAPAGVAWAIRRAVLALAVIAAVAALLLNLGQAPLPKATFEANNTSRTTGC